MATGLATRCSACGTVFRVVPDQLRVSEGWVRCGRCTQVFNALEGLVDLETGMPKAGSPVRAGAGLAPPVPGFSSAQDGPEEDYAIAQPAARPGAPPLPPSPPPPPPPAAMAALRDTPDDYDAATLAAAIAEASDSEIEPRPATSLAPSFVRSADRAARWRRPQVRALLVVLAVLGALGLAGQISHEYRDLLAARVPETRPWLERLCQPLACQVEAARAIESLAVESSGLVRVERSDLYKLQVSLRNRASIALAVPALDITLTDTQGRLVARKVLRSEDMGLGTGIGTGTGTGMQQATIAAGQDLNLQATLQAVAGSVAAAQPIAGYTIDLFYP